MSFDSVSVDNNFPRIGYRHRRSDFISPRLLPAVAAQTAYAETSGWLLNMPKFEYKILEKLGFNIPVDISYQMMHCFHSWFDTRGKPLAHIHVFGSYNVPFFDGPLDAGKMFSRLKLFVFTPDGHQTHADHFKHQHAAVTERLSVADQAAMIASAILIANYSQALDRENPLYTAPGDVIKTILAANVISGHPMAQRILEAPPAAIAVIGAVVAFFLIRNKGGNSNTGCGDIAQIKGVRELIDKAVSPNQAPFIDHTLIPQMVAKKRFQLPEEMPKPFAIT